MTTAQSFPAPDARDLIRAALHADPKLAERLKWLAAGGYRGQLRTNFVFILAKAFTDELEEDANIVTRHCTDTLMEAADHFHRLPAEQFVAQLLDL